MRKLSASVLNSDVLFGFDSNPDGRVEPRTNLIYMYLGPKAYIHSAGMIAGMTLIIKRDGTVLVEKLTHHGSPGLLSSETKDGVLRDDAFEEVKAILRQNEDTLKRQCGCEPWMGWPLVVSYSGNSYALDRESYERGENSLKAIIRELVPLLQKAGVAVLPGDFAC